MPKNRAAEFSRYCSFLSHNPYPQGFRTEKDL
jgi:hypothetical protein